MTDLPANVELKTGDLFTTRLPAFGHGVNVDGIMGAGFARIVRRKNPEVHDAYVQACREGKLQPGQMLPVQTRTGRWALNLASQDRPGRNARLEWIEQSLAISFRFAQFKGLEGFAIPRIGSKIGGLKWADVFEVVKQVAAEHPQTRLEVWTLPQDLEEDEQETNA